MVRVPVGIGEDRFSFNHVIVNLVRDIYFRRNHTLGLVLE